MPHPLLCVRWSLLPFYFKRYVSSPFDHHRLATTRPRHAPVYFHHLSVRLWLSFSNILTIMDWYRTCVYCAPPQFFVSYLRHPVGARSSYALCSWFESREHHRSHRLCQTIAKKKPAFIGARRSCSRARDRVVR